MSGMISPPHLNQLVYPAWNVNSTDIATHAWNSFNGTNDDLSEDYGGEDLWLRYPLHVVIVLCVAYSIVFILGLIGNAFVVAVVIRSPRMRTVTNYFIVNLALADILVVLFCVPATLLSNILVPWVLGLFMCKAVSYLQGVSVSASINTLVAISVDRCLAICYPLRCQLSTRAARKIIVIIWTISLLLTCPWAIYFTVHPYSDDDPDILLCIEEWPNKQLSTAYFVGAHLILCYLFPLVLIAFSYICIGVRVFRRNIPGETKQTDAVVQKSKLKVVKMMLVVVIIFVLSWLPLYAIFTRLRLFGFPADNTFESFLMILMKPIAQWLGSANSCINPVLYAYFNNKFRRGFMAILKSRACCTTLRSQPHSFRSMSYNGKNSTHVVLNHKASQKLHETQVEYLSTAAF